VTQEVLESCDEMKKMNKKEAVPERGLYTIWLSRRE
jgi:hypothetical protein